MFINKWGLVRREQAVSVQQLSEIRIKINTKMAGGEQTPNEDSPESEIKVTRSRSNR